MRQKVLIIDDSVPIHSLVKVRLQTEAVDLFSAYDGESGLDRAAELQPDVILLDVEMPEPGGFEVCRRLKLDPVLSKSMVIFLTGASTTEDKIHGLNLGAVDYVTKPFDAAELKARVRAALRMKYLMDLLEKKAMVDSLTGLWNRGYLDYRLQSEMAVIRRFERPLTCVLIDCDNFKNVNDGFGHPFGDEVLRTIGGIMTASCRVEDIVCRYGGEEFVVLTPGVRSPGATVLAERLRQKLDEHVFESNGQRVKVTCSAGVAELNTITMSTPGDLLAAADKALYQAKLGGRNRVVVAGNEPPTTKAA
jgi:two-component system cell cycle response regulator